AANEISRQLRLRDLGGLIVIDFIDMKDRKHQQEVERTLRNALRKDKARVQVGRISRFGMLELSRQRIKPALQEGSYRVCPFCTGNGLVKTIESQALSVLRRIQAGAQDGALEEVRVALPQDVATYLLNQKREDLHSLEKDSRLEIHVLGKEGLMPHQVEMEFVRREISQEESPAREGVPAQVQTPESAPQPAPRGYLEPAEPREPGQRRRSRRGRRRRREQATPTGHPGYPGSQEIQEAPLFAPLQAREEPKISLLEPPAGQEPLFPPLSETPPLALPDSPKPQATEVIEVSKESVPVDQAESAGPFSDDEAEAYTFPQRRKHGLLFWMGRRRVAQSGEEKVEITYEDEPPPQESPGPQYLAGGYPVQSELEPISHEDPEGETKDSSAGKKDRIP
ncbi:MAG: ribonuclease E/G, partial [Candidatus Tectomicrobia bacterium]|nr:ribonuclease E/G [Candidatus Tectomicrobia bacterium]